jgi:FkbM family methyltransferase
MRPTNLVLPQDGFFSTLLENNSIYEFGKESRDIALGYVTNFNAVIDIGAHVGISVLHWAEHFSSVTAFEPMPKHFECLQQNTQNIKNIQLINCAVSNKTSTLTGAYRTGKNSGSFQLLDDSYTQPSKKSPRTIYTIDSKRLDEFIFNSIGLIKIDVEGWELEVLKGAIDTIKNHRPILLIEFTGGNSTKSLHQYDVMEYQNLINLLEYVPVATSGDDTIYVPKEAL